MKSMPNYTDKPTLVVGAFAENGEVEYAGVEAVGFELPEGVRIVLRDYGTGPLHEDEHGHELSFTDTEVSENGS